jgi:hypothetical protein
MKLMWMGVAVMIGLTSLSIALGAVPQGRSVVTDDTAIYQKLSEIKVPREHRPNFDGDIARLSGLESSYRERLPSIAQDPRLSGSMKRISSQQYRYSGARKKNVASSN